MLRKYLEFIRFSHTVFALPFAALACVWALTVPLTVEVQLSRLAIGLRLLAVLLCMVSARSAAMAFNRLVDAKFDADNPRTAGRHLPAGELTRGQAWLFFAAMVLVFVAACGMFWPNWLPLAGAVPVLLWICGYSLAKRFTSLVHVWLGVALALSPICAWVALRGEQVIASASDLWPAVGLAIAIACWVAGFDVIYACQDVDFDRQQGLHSLPAKLGIVGALRLAALLHGIMLVVLGVLPWIFPQLSLGWLYASAWLLVAVLVLRQHAILRPRTERHSGGAAAVDLARVDLARVNEAFFQINAIISFCLSAAAALDSWLR